MYFDKQRLSVLFLELLKKGFVRTSVVNIKGKFGVFFFYRCRAPPRGITILVVSTESLGWLPPLIERRAAWTRLFFSGKRGYQSYN